MVTAISDDELPPALRWLRWPPMLTLVAAVGLLAVSLAVGTVQGLNNPMTSIRLAPSFALTRGYPIYSLPDQPPWVTVGYGPFYPIMYLPCAVARDPVTAVTLGVILTHLYILGPVALLCGLFCRRLGAARGRALEIGVVPALLLFGVLMFVEGSVEYVSRHIHVDAPTFGLLLLACFAALRADPPTLSRAGLRWTLAAGVLGALSVCCKANALGSLAALGFYILWSAGWRRAGWFALGAVVAGGIVYGLAVWQNGAAAIVHNFRTLGRFPWFKAQSLQFNLGTLEACSREWRDKVFAVAFLGMQSLQSYAAVFLAVGLLARGSDRRATDAGEPATVPPAASASRIIGCLVLVALFGLPASIASAAKYGGAVNSWAFVGLPLSMAAILTLLLVLTRARAIERLAASWALGAAAFFMALGGALIVIQQNPRQGTVMQEAFRTLQAHPGQIYFPSDPLAHLLAGDRFRPNIDVIYSYWVAGFPVDAAAFRSVMPEHLRYVAISSKMGAWGPDEIHRLLPEENVPTDRLGLRFHDVWEKP